MIFGVMRWQYKVSLFLMVLSQTVFLGLAAYHIQSQPYYSNDNPEVTRVVGYSWIWHHFEQWTISLILNIIGVIFFIVGSIKEKRPDWKLSDFIKIKIVEPEE